MSPDLRLSIDRIVLDGFSLTGAETGRLRRAMQRELSRLLTREVPAGVRHSAAVPSIPALSMGRIGPNEPPEAIGTRLAQVIYRGLAP
jgi:hypothetical protein